MLIHSTSEYPLDSRPFVDLTPFCLEALPRLALHGAAMSIADRHTIRLVAATHESYARLERTQQFHARGPLVDSVAANEPMAVRELSADAEVWPELSSLAGQLGIQSALVIPIGMDGGVELVFSAYTRTVRSWSRSNIIVATQIARRALRALHGSSRWDGLVLG